MSYIYIIIYHIYIHSMCIYVCICHVYRYIMYRYISCMGIYHVHICPYLSYSQIGVQSERTKRATTTMKNHDQNSWKYQSWRERKSRPIWPPERSLANPLFFRPSFKAPNFKLLCWKLSLFGPCPNESFSSTNLCSNKKGSTAYPKLRHNQIRKSHHSMKRRKKSVGVLYQTNGALPIYIWVLNQK